MSNPNSSEGKANLILNHPITAIYAINAVDCFHLNLIEEIHLKDFLKLLIRMTEKPVAEFDNHFWSEFIAWSNEHRASDKRNSLDHKDLKLERLETVMTFEKAYYKFKSIFDAANKKKTKSVASKVLVLRSKTLPKFRNSISTLTSEQVTDWIESIINIEKSETKVPLVPTDNLTIWSKPTKKKSKGVFIEANEIRDKLGLIHLPENEYPAATTLIVLELATSELITDSSLKRPGIFEGPNSRFRALSKSELSPSCNKINRCGRTVDINKNLKNESKFSDGVKELVFGMKKNLSFQEWKFKKVDGILTLGTHLEIVSHQKFIEHLLSIAPKNNVICNYRNNGNEAVKSELMSYIT